MPQFLSFLVWSPRRPTRQEDTHWAVYTSLGPMRCHWLRRKGRGENPPDVVHHFLEGNAFSNQEEGTLIVQVSSRERVGTTNAYAESSRSISTKWACFLSSNCWIQLIDHLLPSVLPRTILIENGSAEVTYQRAISWGEIRAFLSLLSCFSEKYQPLLIARFECFRQEWPRNIISLFVYSPQITYHQIR